MITESFEDLQIPNEVQSERHSKLKEIIDSTQDYHSLLEGQKLLYVELMLVTQKLVQMLKLGKLMVIKKEYRQKLLDFLTSILKKLVLELNG